MKEADNSPKDPPVRSPEVSVYENESVATSIDTNVAASETNQSYRIRKGWGFVKV